MMRKTAKQVSGGHLLRIAETVSVINKAFILLLISFVASAQPEKRDAVSLEITQLCEQIGPTNKVIGLGESTHGTKEFTTVRTQLVKTLINKHGFRVFILEADYIPCSEINQYVRSGKGNPSELLKAVLLWPWIHQDFLDLINWIRDYNTQNPSDQVYFLGMDSQLSKLYATKDAISKDYPAKAASVFEIIESDEKPKAKIEALRALSAEIIEQSDKIDLRLHYYILCRINRTAHLNYRNLDTRDQNMAYLTELIHKKYGKKMIIWAHNDHLCKRQPSLFGKTPAGYHLAHKFKNSYASVALDFKSGRFNAVDYENDESKQPRPFQLKPIETTLSMKIDHGNKKMVILDCDTMTRKTYINSIGAIYVSKPTKGDAFTAKIKKDKEFDYIISIPRSSPTELLIEQ